MTDISAAIARLKKDGIESFEGSGILIIPCDDPEAIYDLATKVRRIFKEIGYEKSWQVDPYYWDKHRREDGSLVIERQEFV
jgi:hypothetical protein